ncbi:helix-turn-helix domain-containing protein [Embleya sp. NPDC059259]|uniref:helix-turn-helix domain-containing protein n=1 Tax=unclassified Embleya TaxID=2699296 RepID=UPI0036A00444
MMEDIESATPALCRLQLGAELRRLRRDAGLKSGQVAKRLLWSPSKLTRLESGDNVVVEPDDTAALCALYGADPDTRSLLNTYATVTKTKQDRWDEPRDQPSVRPGLHAFIGIEASAASVRVYASEYVPGLLQTATYARETHRAAPMRFSSEEIEVRVAARTARQGLLLREEKPLESYFILNESLLRRRAMGREATREQLRHIAEVSTLHNVRVQVLPYSAGLHNSMACSFSLFRFTKVSASEPIVYLENMPSRALIGYASVVDEYERAFSDLLGLSLSPHDSLDMIRVTIEEL